MRSPDLERVVPALRSAEYEVTSPRDENYNCAAWVVGDATQIWDPSGIAPYFWPEGLPRQDWSVANYIRAYELEGFEVCGDDSSLEDEIEKIAIYSYQGRFHHAALQLPSGRWASKCGLMYDIIHDSPHEIEGDVVGYGRIETFMQRLRFL